MSKQPRNTESDGASDESIRQLLREVGARDLPSSDVMNEVRQAVQGEWRSMVDQRRQRNRFIGYAAAGVAAVALAVTLTVQFASGPAEPVASIARVEGVLQAAAGGSGEWRTVAAGDSLIASDTLRTDVGTRVALNLGGGVSVRIDSGSLVQLAAPDRIVLDHGGIYIDAGPMESNAAAASNGEQHPSHQLVVETLYGSVRHLGTQYQLRTARNSIEVSVREGRIEITGPSGVHSGSAGEQLVIPREGAITRTTISPQDSDWQWATSIAPTFDIERQPLTAFLTWIARETGKQIEYATPQARTRAEQLILRGSVNNLAPEQALAAVLATTPFTHSETASTIHIQ